MTKRRSYLRRSAPLILLLVICIPVLLTLRRLRHQSINQQLIAAVKVRDTRLAVSLLDEGADPNSREASDDDRTIWRKLWDILRGSAPKVNRTATALLLAVDPNPYDNKIVAENVPLVKALLDHGADVNRTDELGTTPLMIAAQQSMTDLASLFLVRGARVDATDHNDTTAVMQAVASQDPSVLELLLTRGGANVNARDSEGASLLESAAIDSSPHMVSILLKHGANVNAADSSGMTALLAAVLVNSVDEVRSLVAAGANLEAHDSNGSTPLKLASDINADEIITILKKAGAKR